MDDYISRQALISEIEDAHCRGCDWMAGGICKNCRINKFLQEIKAVPPVDIPGRIVCKIVFPEEQQAALLSSLKKSLANMPIMAIQDEPMPMRLYARWIELENPDYSPFDPTSHEYDLLCSLCGATHNGPNRNFCPNCGADMRGEKTK